MERAKARQWQQLVPRCEWHSQPSQLVPEERKVAFEAFVWRCVWFSMIEAYCRKWKGVVRDRLGEVGVDDVEESRTSATTRRLLFIGGTVSQDTCQRPCTSWIYKYITYAHQHCVLAIRLLLRTRALGAAMWRIASSFARRSFVSQSMLVKVLYFSLYSLAPGEWTHNAPGVTESGLG